MNKDVKTLWIAALESGEYEQGRAALKQGGPGSPRFCCLGVLCELAVEAEVIPPALLATDGWYYDAVDGGDWTCGSLPQKVAEWAGLEDESGGYIREGSLIALNDVQRFTFQQIACVIADQL